MERPHDKWLPVIAVYELWTVISSPGFFEGSVEVHSSALPLFSSSFPLATLFDLL